MVAGESLAAWAYLRLSARAARERSIALGSRRARSIRAAAAGARNRPSAKTARQRTPGLVSSMNGRRLATGASRPSRHDCSTISRSAGSRLS